MNDFTLIIPTYNRPMELHRLLRYLAHSGADFPVDILDSSAPEAARRNRQAVAESPLRTRYLSLDEATDPFDKFRLGAGQVETPFAALCPDDDIPFLSGLQASLAQLRADAGLAVSHGWYFLFSSDGGDRFDLHSVIYHAAGYLADDPLRRLHRLARRYQALTYGVYRTAVLRDVLARASRMDSLLWREHLASAAAVVAGKVGRVGAFYMGRRAGGHAARRHWHPVEWLIADPGGMMQSFAQFAGQLAGHVCATDPGRRSVEEVLALVHLIYADYLAQNIPQDIFDPIVENRLAGMPAGEIFRLQDVVLPVLEASRRYQEEVVPGTGFPAEITIRSPLRSYRFHPPFLRMFDRLAGAGQPDLLRQVVVSLDRWSVPAG